VPDENAAEEKGDEVFCFFDHCRPCTAECVAYESVVPDDKDYKNKPWAHCMVLVNVHRTGKHLVTLASGLGRIINHVTDQARNNQPRPPRPT
jgi:hypothetical protein